jgi:hypothetical protein
MANLRRRIPWQTESLFAENHEAFFNSIGHGTNPLARERAARGTERVALAALTN